jgi:hypothetical protein
MKRRSIRGSTLLEAVSSAGMLSMLVFAAFAASRTALRATDTVVGAEATAGRTDHTLGKLRQLFLSASVASLAATPAGGVVPEPMQPDVDYDNVEFRIVTGWANGAPTLVPPAGEAPWKVRVEVAQDGRRSLVHEDGKSTTRLLDDVGAVTFRLDGICLHLSLSSCANDCDVRGGDAVLDFVLRVP